MNTSPQAAGGNARAKKLSARERSAIASQGGQARWNGDGTPAKKRGPKPKPPGTLAIDTRKNVSLDADAQLGLVKLQGRLALRMGFVPTLTQTVLWLIARAESLMTEVGETT